MIKFILALILLFPSVVYPQLNNMSRQELPFKNSLAGKNNGFESGAAGWTCSPALVMDTDAADQIVPNSNVMATWDSTSAAQNCYSTAVKIPESGTCAVGIWYAIPSGTGTHLIVANDGVGDLATRAIVSSALGQYQEVEFPCTSSTTGNARVGIRSVAANEPLIQADDGYIGRPTVITSSTGTGRNYIKANPDAEIDTSGWVLYADAAGSIPVDGVGGSAVITWDRTTSTPLAETGSFLLTKDAANRQGNGVAFDFSIEPEDRGRMLQIDYSYEIASGTYATGDLSWHIYDVTNGRYIQPSAYQVENVGVQSHAQPLTFQTSINSTSYRLILHVASTSASAYTAKFDSVKVGPQNTAQGPPSTQTQSFTPTGSWVSNTTYTGNWRQVGEFAEIQIRVVTSGAPTSANLTINLPSGLVIDSSKLLQGGAGFDEKLPSSSGRILDNGSTYYDADAYYSSTTAILVKSLNASGTYAANTGTVTQSVPMVWTTGDELNLSFRVPIVGWSSNTVVSSSANVRPVVASFSPQAPSGTLSAAFNTVTWSGSPSVDTHGGWNGSTTYTVKVPGYYESNAQLEITGTYSLGNEVGVRFLINGATSWGNGAVTAPGAVNRMMPSTRSFARWFNAGDTIIVQSYFGGSGGSWTTNFTASYWAIRKVDGPSQIQAGNLVEASYTSNTGVSLSAGVAAIRVYEDKVTDTHNAYNASTGVFTAPAPGDYMICASAVGGAASLALSDEFAVIFRKNSVEVYRDGVFSPVAATITQSARGCHQFRLNATDTLDVQLLSDKAMTTNAVTLRNTLHIHRLGGVH